MLVQVLLCVVAGACGAVAGAGAGAGAGEWAGGARSGAPPLQLSGSGVFDDQMIESAIDEERCNRHKQEMSAFQFYDASFRFPQGFQTGNLISLGNYFQCLEIRQELSSDDVIEGKHCLIEVPLEGDTINVTLPGLPGLPGLPWPRYPWSEQTLRLYRQLKRDAVLLAGVSREDEDAAESRLESPLSANLQLGVCIPKSCSVQQGLEPVFNNSLFVVNYSVRRCRVMNDKPRVGADYVAIVVFLLIGLITLLSTGYEVRHLFIMKRDVKQLSEVLSCCSVYGNTKNLFSFPHNPRALHCLDGLRSLSVMWVIIGHTFLTMFLGGISNIISAIEWYQDIRSLWLVSANISVDTFFMLSGLLLVYTSVSKMTQVGLFKNLHLYYLNRYLRMFPVLATAVLLQASYFHRIADGANWTLEGRYVHYCREYWWAALLHIQNYFNPLQDCLPHTWYLAVDFQLHLLSPLVLVWVLGSRRSAWLGLTTAFLLSFFSAAAYNYIYISNTNMYTDPDSSHFTTYYINTFTRAPTFLVGMIFGYVLYVCRGKKIQLPAWFVSVCWAASVVLFSCVIYAYRPHTQQTVNIVALSNYHDSFNRTIWCIAMGWVIFACVHGYGGPVNWFLSLTVWKFIAKLSYALYIFHYPLQFIKSSAIIAPIYFSFGNLWLLFFNDVVLSLLLSLAVVVLVDAPFTRLQVMLLGPGMKKPPPPPAPLVDILRDEKPAVDKKTIDTDIQQAAV